MNELLKHDKFSALLDAAVDGILIIDEQGIIEVANESVERMLGYDVAGIVGQNINLLMPSPYREQHDRYLSEHLRTGRTSIIGVGREVAAQKKDGSIIEIYLSVGKYDDGQSTKFVGIIRDLSELNRNKAELVQKQAYLKSAEQEIHDLINRLAHASRIGVMGEMAASIAHEVNQPLTAISSYAQACERLLIADNNESQDIISTLGKISEQAIRAGDIIKGLRAWVRDQDTERVVSDCNALVTEVADIASMEAKNKDLCLELSLDSKIPKVMCDPVQIQQVTLNLIKNAMDSVAECALEKSDPRRTISIFTELLGEERVRVSVSDLGSGVDEGVAENLFNAFFTTKDSGMGMGLSISRTIVKAHGGELDFSANSEGGVTFYFVLPTTVEDQ